MFASGMAGSLGMGVSVFADSGHRISGVGGIGGECEQGQADYEEGGKNRFQRAHVFSKPGVGVVVWLKRADKLPWRDFFHKGFFATRADSSKCINIGDWRN